MSERKAVSMGKPKKPRKAAEANATKAGKKASSTSKALQGDARFAHVSTDKRFKVRLDFDAPPTCPPSPALPLDLKAGNPAASVISMEDRFHHVGISAHPPSHLAAHTEAQAYR